jgi:CheY-like chemotaxis protein
MLKEATGLNKQTLLELLINQASVALSQKQSEKAQKIAKDKAEESDRLKSAFLMNLSHEIRTPLNGIMGFSQILQEREFPFEKQKEFLNIIHEKADQLLHILNDILDLSKIEAEQMNIRQEDFYLNDMFHELYDQHLMELEKKEKNAISLSYYCGLDREKSRLYSDHERFRQILSNLLSNAVKFTGEGSISFGYDITDQDTLFFYVRDTGIGIPDQKREEIFEPFRQADDSTNRAYEGTGLGLSLAKGLVELLGGKMWMESEKGKGTSFYFTIQHSKHKYQPAETERPEEGEAYMWPGQQIMIVEDDPVSLEFMQEIFSETEAKLITAQTGEEALRRYRDNPDITIILMDIRLPDMSGLEVVKQIRKQNSHIPIIAQTAYTMDNDARKCKEAGCNDYLTKPIDIQAMLSVINKHLKQHI